MAVTVVKNEGSDPSVRDSSTQLLLVGAANATLKFSELRLAFKEVSSGSVSASELFRNTNVDVTNPIVPDSTENEDISPDTYDANGNLFSGNGTNLVISTLRNSVKRYKATQSGTQSQFDAGRFDGTNGVDWSGGGASGRDSTNFTNGNYSKNVPKTLVITGHCYSTDTGTDGDPQSNNVGSDKASAAKLIPGCNVYNNKIEVTGKIHGAGGLGGNDTRGWPHGNAPGKDGGNALKISHQGNATEVIVGPNAEIWGGGGGGEQGSNGETGDEGPLGDRADCQNTYVVDQCNGTPSCNAGDTLISGPTVSGRCNRNEFCWIRGPFGICLFRNVTYDDINQITCGYNEKSTTPAQGIGGAGGNGVGYNQARTDGAGGTAPSDLCPVCPPGTTKVGGRCGQPGGSGGDGGDWGQAGESTAGENAGGTGDIHDGGRGGTAICGTKPGTNTKSYTVSGTITTTTLKGLYETGGCDGTQAEEPDTPPPTISFQTPQYVRFSYPAASHLMVTAPDGIGVSFRLKYDYEDNPGRQRTHLDRLSLRRPDTNAQLAYWSSIRNNGDGKVASSSYLEGNGNAYLHPPNDPIRFPSLYGVFGGHPNILLGAGEYPLVWDYDGWNDLEEDEDGERYGYGVTQGLSLNPTNTIDGVLVPHANSTAKPFNRNGATEFMYCKELHLEDDGMDTSEWNGRFRLGTTGPSDLGTFEEFPDAQIQWTIGGEADTVTATSSPNDPTFNFPGNSLSGSIGVKPIVTTTYTITAIGPGGSVSKSVTIK
tara:strand:+ start:2167 stop:4464 length:2298 start_codon:yes stop_codon:yes gene_type:complete